jgi:hypothetical protein
LDSLRRTIRAEPRQRGAASSRRERAVRQPLRSPVPSRAKSLSR